MPGVLAADDGGLYLSGTTPLAEIASDPVVRSSYPLLAAAAALETGGLAGSTLGASLATSAACGVASQGVTCALNATSTCAARDSSTEPHAILEGGPCWKAFTSLTGVALHALDAAIELGDGAQQGNVQRVHLPADAANGFQYFNRAPQDATPGIAAISVAAVRRTDGDVRLVLGGVSPRPYRVYTSVEEEAMAGGLDDETIAGLAERALLDAEVDVRSAGKLAAAEGLLRGAISEIAANSA